MIQEVDAEDEPIEESKGNPKNRERNRMTASQDFSENLMSRQRALKTKAEPKLDLLPNEPPKRSRLETLALPKSRPSAKNEPRHSHSGPKHQFTGVGGANHMHRTSMNPRL